MTNSLSLKIKVILILSLFVVEAWSSQLDQSDNSKDSSCKKALSKNADLEDSKYDDKTKAYLVEVVKKHKGNVLAVTRALNEEGIELSEETVRDWTREHEQETGEKIVNTHYDDETKAYAIKIVKQHNGDVLSATRELNKEGISVSEQSVQNWWNNITNNK